MDFSFRGVAQEALYFLVRFLDPTHDFCKQVEKSRQERARLKRLRFIRVSFAPFTKDAALRYLEERSRADNRQYFLPTTEVFKHHGEKIVDDIEPGPEVKRTTPQPRVWGLADGHQSLDYYSPKRGWPRPFRSDSSIPWLAPGVALLYLFWDPAQ